MTCNVENCVGDIRARGMCNKHYELFMKYGDPLVRKRAERGTGTVSRGRRIVSGRFEHVIKAERALGRPLPPGACVHHADGNPANNENHNLVICPDQAYHSLLHQRLRAYRACGNPDWRKCKRCKKWDSPENLAIYTGEAMHRACNAAHTRRYAR